MGYRIKNNSLKWTKKIFLTKPLVRLLFLLFCCQGVQARLWLRWVKVISTNFHKMGSACADRFGRCIKWLIYCTMYEYEKNFTFFTYSSFLWPPQNLYTLPPSSHPNFHMLHFFSMTSLKSIYLTYAFLMPLSIQYYQYVMVPPNSSQTTVCRTLCRNTPVVHICYSNYFMQLFPPLPPPDNSYPHHLQLALSWPLTSCPINVSYILVSFHKTDKLISILHLKWYCNTPPFYQPCPLTTSA